MCLEQGADLHMAQLMPLPLSVSCFRKIQVGLPFWYRLNRVVLDKGPLNGCVCVTYLIYGIYTNFRRLLCKKCDERYYVINHGAIKLPASVI